MASKPMSDAEILRIQRFRKRLFRALCVLGFFILLGWAVSPWIKIGFNGTNSVDGYVFLIVKNVKPERGELMAFWPPKNDFYNNIWFVKYAKGVAGDVVDVRGQSFFLNGEYVGDAKTVSAMGVPLQAAKPGRILGGYYFVWTPHKDSFDSRYAQIGLISERSVIGRAYRIF